MQPSRYILTHEPTLLLEKARPAASDNARQCYEEENDRRQASKLTSFGTSHIFAIVMDKIEGTCRTRESSLEFNTHPQRAMCWELPDLRS